MKVYQEYGDNSISIWSMRDLTIYGKVGESRHTYSHIWFTNWLFYPLPPQTVLQNIEQLIIQVNIECFQTQNCLWYYSIYATYNHVPWTITKNCNTLKVTAYSCARRFAMPGQKPFVCDGSECLMAVNGQKTPTNREIGPITIITYKWIWPPGKVLQSLLLIPPLWPRNWTCCMSGYGNISTLNIYIPFSLQGIWNRPGGYISSGGYICISWGSLSSSGIICFSQHT